MRKTIFTLTILLIGIVLNAQYIGFEEIDESCVYPWEEDKPEQYFAVYHYGDSEAEYGIVVYGDGKMYYAQLKSGGWAGDEMRWVRDYSNITNVKIQGNKFTSDQYFGAFVIYDSEDEDEKIYGLKLSLTGRSRYEIGYKSGSLENYFSGKFSEASYRFLKEDELRKLSKEDLRIMRNEIFARYGYIFKPGGNMDAYFKNEKWYSADHKNVDAFITELEKINIKTIQKIEKEK